ncbi:MULTISPECIES: 3-oxoacyl-ACP reductase FabG [Acidianus]|uniref:3-oxoacyl-ACP synthase n=1 Tax=Candidatus Acidianus copahuensis TaxID=1160895 RepID=A0A031LSL5_9CREN|nr:MULTISPECIES: 3-oxoacyl-ACP reductase FabG [Acidianus]EZQ11377.1 3-oxoacyl-ACP synthase [Candidatus Acidianus copahuensis]NON61465.1 3-oxoacyl-ACP reductase FabG [Acidianus sp. RZ1]
MEIPYRLDGKYAVITGSASGIGRGIAEKLASLGSNVILGDVRDEVSKVAKEISERFNVKALGLQLNVADFSSCQSFYLQATKSLGIEGIDILVNNAGINRDSLFVKMTYEQWDEVIKVDLYSMFNMTKQVVEGMIKRNYGRIINVSSMSWLGNIGQANYAAAKSGVIGFTKTLAKELARYNVTVNAIAPGFIDTPMTRAVPEKVRQKFIERIAMGRIGTPEDVSNLVGFLASKEASYITGEVISVSGGLTM